MLLLDVENIDGVMVTINAELICSITLVDKNRKNAGKPGQKPDWDNETCGIAMANGVVFHVKKSAKAIRASMAGYSGSRR